MLQGGKDIELHAGQQIILVAVGSAYDTWEGGLDEARGMVKIGISYDKLCSSVREGNMIKIADGSLSVEVEEVLSTTELRARWGAAVVAATCAAMNCHLASDDCNDDGLAAMLSVQDDCNVPASSGDLAASRHVTLPGTAPQVPEPQGAGPAQERQPAWRACGHSGAHCQGH